LNLALSHNRRHCRPRRLPHRAATRAYRWLSKRKLLRLRPGEHFVIREHELALGHLPKSLEGLRIAHLTDLHVGPLLRPDHLPGIVEETNDQQCDLIAVTGDLIDHSNRHLPEVIDAMRNLEAPLGVYFVLGNHDYRDNVGQILRAFEKEGLNMLLNQAVSLEHRGASISIGGIDYAERRRDLLRLVRATATQMPRAGLRLLLAHHPHAFDVAAGCGIDLTLSGHTHGGQWLFRKHGAERPSLGLGNLAWRYPQGLYQRGRSKLFVSNGVGSSFPVRIKCPPEISILRLHRTLGM
jgi:hypothetical protein